MKEPLVPPEFNVPTIFACDHFVLEPLTTRDLEIDYITVIANLYHLKGIFGPRNNWPFDDLSRERNYHDLEWHEVEFANRTSFAYSVRSLEKEYLGCVYIYPSFNPDFDSMIIIWVKKDSPLKKHSLYIFIKRWISEIWPLKNPAFPGIEINWDALDMSNVEEWSDYYIRD